MKKFNFFFMIVLAVAGITITGCKKSENPVNSGDNSGGHGFVTPDEFGGSTPLNVLAVVRVAFAPGMSLGVGVADLNKQDKGNVSVTVGGTEYEFTKTSDQGSTSYYFGPTESNPTGGINLGPGAVDATFSVQNYSLTSATVQIPGDVSLTSPTANSTVSRSSDLTITWNSTGTPMASGVIVADAQGKSVEKTSLSGNAGSASFTAAELGGLSAGSAVVYAFTYNYVLSNNNEAVLLGEAIAMSTVTLQ